MKKRKITLKIIPIIIGLLILFGVAFLIQNRNFSDQSRASTNVMVGRLIKSSESALCTKCVQQCPGSDNVLRDCNPMASYGISIDSTCNVAGRVETCGTKTFCCPKPNGRWTTDLSKCPGVTPSPEPSAQYRLLKSGGVCTALVVSKTLADPLLYKEVVATGTLKEPYFYASQLVEDKPGCDSTQRDTPITTKLKFPRTGKVAIFTMSNVAFRSSVKLTGPKNITLDLVPNVQPAKSDQTFDVIAGEQYSLSMVVKYPNNTTKPAVGWIPPAQTNQCGPKKNPGQGKCGVLWDITKLVNYAKANSSGITGIKAGTSEANIGCWADPKANNPLEDYDFNDWAMIFGYVGDITPTPSTNNLPYFTTTQLPSGVINTFYSAYITAKDADLSDTLSMSIINLPPGITAGPCATPSSGGEISCYISGTPTTSGYFTIGAKVTDSRNGAKSTNFSFSILPPSTPTPTL